MNTDESFVTRRAPAVLEAVRKAPRSGPVCAQELSPFLKNPVSPRALPGVLVQRFPSAWRQTIRLLLALIPGRLSRIPRECCKAKGSFFDAHHSVLLRCTA